MYIMSYEDIKGGKEIKVRKGVTEEVPQQSGPIAALLWDVSGS